MTELFQREWQVTVGRVQVSAPLRVAFDITRTTRPQPNQATIRLYNLARETRARLQDSAEASVCVEAGYANETAQLFGGQVVRARARELAPVRAEREGLDVVSVIEAADSGHAYARARVNRSYEAGVSVTTVLRDCAEALGVGAGNVSEVQAFAQLEGGQTTYPEGTVLSGQAARELTRILRSYGLRWSIQHGALQVTRRGEALQTQAVRLSASTGLVGSPQVKTQGRVSVRVLLTPALWPGRRVVVEAELVRGQFLTESVRYQGDSHGDAWFADLELVPEQVQ